MYHFKFDIPTNEDGSRVTYSPGWHGTMPKCPKKVTVLLYNDKEGYGIATTEDNFIPPEVEVLNETAAKAILKNYDEDEEGVYFGDKLVHRWDEEVLDGREIP